MPLLTSTELLFLRDEIQNTLDDSCSISRPTTSVDAYGHVSETYSNVATGVKCRLDPYTTRQDTQQEVAEREAGRMWFVLTLPWDANIAEGDRVIIGSTTYELVRLHDVHTERLVKRAIVARIQGS